MLCIFIFKNTQEVLCKINNNKRVRGNFKIKKIDFLRVRENSEQS